MSYFFTRRSGPTQTAFVGQDKTSLQAVICLYTLGLALFVSLFSGYVGGSAPTAHAQPPNVARPTSQFAPGEVLVKFRPWVLAFGQVQPEDFLQVATLHNMGLSNVQPVTGAPALFRFVANSGSDIKSLAAQFAADNAIEYAEPNYSYKLAQLPNDELYKNGKQFYMGKIGLDSAWNITTGLPLTVAVVDSGVQANHPDLSGKVLPGFNAFNGTTDTHDDNGHGTFVSGIIAANTNNAGGIAGVNWAAKILPIKVADAAGEVRAEASSVGIRYAADNGASIINLSYGGEEDSQTQDDAVRYALSKNVTVVVAAGNTPDGAPEYPAAVPGVIAVGASDSLDQVAYFSSYGPFVSLVAPGIQIWSTNINKPNGEFGPGTYTVSQGTSFSAPLVSGVASLLLSLNKGLTPPQVKTILEGTADPLSGQVSRTDASGYGRVNAFKALQAVQAGDLAPGRHGIVQGKIIGLQSSLVVMNLDPGGNVTPNPDGTFQFADLAVGKYSLRAVAPNLGRILGPVQLTIHGNVGDAQTVTFNFTNNTIVTGNISNPPPSPADVTQFFAPLAPVASRTDLYYFKETAHTLSGNFKSYWDKYGGISIFGFPISEPFQETSATDGQIHLVQYFERNRFEAHPEFVGSPNEVLLGLLGSELTKNRNFTPAAPIANTLTSLYFPQTQHILSDRFLNYWQSNGGLAIFGYPISEPLNENGLIVQYFERNRFEYHPENVGTKYEVLLGLLGTDLAHSKNYVK